MDIYTFLFKTPKTKKTISFRNCKFQLKYYKEEKPIYEVYEYGRIVVDKQVYYSEVTILKREYDQEKFTIFLELVNIINKYNFMNYTIIDDNLLFNKLDFMTINTLSGMENPYLKDRYQILQTNFPESQNIDILKSNAYYYSKFFKQNIKSIRELTIKKFLQLLKRIYKDEFESKKYLEDFSQLAKFDYTLKQFITDKANLDQISCFKFFYDKMTIILKDLYLLPKKYVKFY
jgi:hypothetical protein